MAWSNWHGGLNECPQKESRKVLHMKNTATIKKQTKKHGTNQFWTKKFKHISIDIIKTKVYPFHNAASDMQVIPNYNYKAISEKIHWQMQGVFVKTIATLKAVDFYNKPVKPL